MKDQARQERFHSPRYENIGKPMDENLAMLAFRLGRYLLGTTEIEVDRDFLWESYTNAQSVLGDLKGQEHEDDQMYTFDEGYTTCLNDVISVSLRAHDEAQRKKREYEERQPITRAMHDFFEENAGQAFDFTDISNQMIQEIKNRSDPTFSAYLDDVNAIQWVLDTRLLFPVLDDLLAEDCIQEFLDPETGHSYSFKPQIS